MEVVTDRELEALNPQVFTSGPVYVTPLQVQVALRAGAKVLGVNNRNLHTLVLDKHRTEAISQETRLRNVKSHPTQRQCLLASRARSWHGGVWQLARR